MHRYILTRSFPFCYRIASWGGWVPADIHPCYEICREKMCKVSRQVGVQGKAENGKVLIFRKSTRANFSSCESSELSVDLPRRSEKTEVPCKRVRYRSRPDRLFPELHELEELALHAFTLHSLTSARTWTHMRMRDTNAAREWQEVNRNRHCGLEYPRQQNSLLIQY